MDATQKPSKNLFVVYGKHDRQRVEKLLEAVGEVKELQGGHNLLLVHLRKEASAPKQAWESVRKKLGDEEVVHPVLLDESGNQQYPTGEINVRFQSPLTDAQLKRFAASHGMRLHSRNEYVPEQAIFEPLKAGEQYVPELVKEISGETNIKQAWANTLSHFERL